MNDHGKIAFLRLKVQKQAHRANEARHTNHRLRKSVENSTDILDFFIAQAEQGEKPISLDALRTLVHALRAALRYGQVP